jgi:hypothetical protein
MSLENEKLKFRVGVSGTYWDKKPKYSIAINGIEYASGEITAPSGVTEYIEFGVELEEVAHRLEVSLLNKENSDTVKGPTDASGNFTIANDMLLNVEHIEIDDIDIGHLRFSKSYYEPVKKQLYNGAVVTRIDQCVNMGWNGAYILEFSSPFYIWLLENL